MLGVRRSAFNCLARHLGGYCTTAAQSFGFWHHQPHCKATPSVEVCFVDPKLVLDLQENKAAAQRLSQIEITISECLVSELSKAHQAPLMVASVQTGGLCSSVVLQAVNELGDTDDPMNNWYFGKSGEIFQYQLVGTHPTTSGFTSIISKHILEDLLAGKSTCKLPSWQEFTKLVDSGAVKWPSEKLPFLFAGRMVDSATAAVYALREGTHIAGLMVSSEAFS